MDDLARNDPEPVQAFISFLDGKDSKTIAVYRTTYGSLSPGWRPCLVMIPFA